MLTLLEREMHTKEMSSVLGLVAKMSAVQRAILALALQGRRPKDEVLALVETRLEGANLRCPHCACVRLVRNGHASGLQRYKCRGCTRTFNALTGSPMARLRMKEKWFEQQEVLRDGISVPKAAKRLGVSPRTAFRWRHRFLRLAQPVMATDLVGVVEADETFFLHSCKGQALEGRKPRKRGGKGSRRGATDGWVPVLVARDRSGATADFVLSAASKANLVAAMAPILHKDAVLCSDSSLAMTTAAKQLGVLHEPINLAEGVRTRGPWHIQNVNNYHSRLKGWMDRFMGVATDYLPSYLAWFRALDRVSKTPQKLAPLLSLALGLGLITN